MMQMPVLRGVLPISGANVSRDILAGVTLAALGIPEVMGYTKIAGTPVVTGLYTILLPLVVYALLGGSRHLVVAADSATAAILAGSLVVVAALASPHYVELTGVTAIVVAILLLAARVLRLGFLADFLSRSALIGFLTGVGIQVAIGELPRLIGLPKEGHGSLEQLASFVRRVPEGHVTPLIIALAVIAVAGSLERLAPRIPSALVSVVGAILVSSLFDLKSHGVEVVGAVPSGLPKLVVPSFNWSEAQVVAATALSCFIVILTQSAATSRAYANRYNETFDENLDLIGLAGANAAAALTGTFVVNGSPTKTEMVDAAGGRSQIAHLTTALIVLLVLLFFTGPLSVLPSAVLSAIVFLIGVKLVDVKGLRELFRVQRDEWVVALLAAASVVFFNVMDGIVIAVGASLITHVRHSYRVRTRLLAPDADNVWRSSPVSERRLAAPGVAVYEFEAELFFANAGFFMEEVLSIASYREVRWVVLDASGIDTIDYTAAKTLLQLREELDRRGIGLSAAAIKGKVAKVLARYRQEGGLYQLSDYPSVKEALETALAELAKQRAKSSP